MYTINFFFFHWLPLMYTIDQKHNPFQRLIKVNLNYSYDGESGTPWV